MSATYKQGNMITGFDFIHLLPLFNRCCSYNQMKMKQVEPKKKQNKMKFKID